MLVKSALIAHSLAGALAANTAPHLLASASSDTPAAAERLIEVGRATWYHRQHAPNITATGERYNPMGMTAAHRSIRLNEIVRVTDQTTGRSVVVRVNDREPPHGTRCIDLSEGAAYALGIHGQGVARVTITELANAGAPNETEVAEAPDNAPSRPVAVHRHAHAHRRH